MPEQFEKSRASVPDGAEIALFQVYGALDLLECYFKQRGTDFDHQAIDLVLTIRRVINLATRSNTSGGKPAKRAAGEAARRGAPGME